MLKVLAVVVQDIQVPVGSVGEVHRPEPAVGGCEEVRFRRPAAGGIRRAFRLENVAMNEIAGTLPDEDPPGESGGKRVSQVDGRAGRRGEESLKALDAVRPGLGVTGLPRRRAVDAPLLGLADREDRRRRSSVVGNVLLGRFHGVQRVALQVAGRDHRVAQVHGVLRDEPVAPLVVGVPELRVSGRCFCDPPQGVEPELAVADVDRRNVRPGGRRDLAGVRVVDDVEPVVQSEPRIAQTSFHVGEREACVEHLADVGPVISVDVLQVEDVGSGRRYEASLPGRDAFHGENPVREYRVPVDDTVPVRVLEVLDPAQRSVSFRGVLGVVEELGDVHASEFIESHLDRIDDVRLRGEQLDAESRSDLEGPECLVGGQRERSLKPTGKAGREQRHGPPRNPRRRRARTASASAISLPCRAPGGTTANCGESGRHFPES